MTLQSEPKYEPPVHHARRRPKMYIGSTNSAAMHQVIFGVLDYMITDAFARFCSHIWITLENEDTISIRDNSPGLPVDGLTDPHQTVMMTSVLQHGHHLGDYRDYADLPYEPQGGLHGMGISIVAPYTAQLIVENKRDGYLWRQVYHAGEPSTDVEQIRLLTDDEGTGTTFIFTPDFTILERNPFDREILIKRCREMAHLIDNLTISLRDERTESAYEETFHAPEGVKTMVLDMTSGYTPLHEIVHVKKRLAVPQKGTLPDFMVEIEFAYQICEEESGRVLSYVNSVESIQGGSHLAAFKAGILSRLNEVLANEYPDEISLRWEDIASGFFGVIAIRHPDPQYISLERVQLLNPDVFGPIAGLAYQNIILMPAPIFEKVIARRA